MVRRSPSPSPPTTPPITPTPRPRPPSTSRRRADDHLGGPGGDRLRHGASQGPSSTPRPACPGPSPTRRPQAPSWAGKGQTLSVSFTPNDTTDYNGRAGTTTIDVAQVTSKATPTITWAAPAGINYGTASRRPSSTPRPACPGHSPTRRRSAPSWASGMARRSPSPSPPTTPPITPRPPPRRRLMSSSARRIADPFADSRPERGRRPDAPPQSEPLRVRIRRDDPELDVQPGLGCAAGASIDATTGALTWPLGTNQPIGTYPITVRVFDNGAPQQVAAATFNVNVVDPGPAPTISGAIVSMKKGFSITLSFSQPVNPGTAANPSNYILTQPAKSHTSKKKSPPQAIRIGLSVSYNQATNQVTLKGPRKVKAGRGLHIDGRRSGSERHRQTGRLASRRQRRATGHELSRECDGQSRQTDLRRRGKHDPARTAAHPRVSTLTPMLRPIPSPMRGPRGRARRLYAGRADEPVLRVTPNSNLE